MEKEKLLPVFQNCIEGGKVLYSGNESCMGRDKLTLNFSSFKSMNISNADDLSPPKLLYDQAFSTISVYTL